MAHTLSVSRAKGTAKYIIAPEQKPREGTKLRALYDLFYANKGKTIAWSSRPGDSNNAKLNALRDIYGLDIRRLRNRKWVLAGEWFGNRYVDYIAENNK